jgi:hypothetical protein
VLISGNKHGAGQPPTSAHGRLVRVLLVHVGPDNRHHGTPALRLIDDLVAAAATYSRLCRRGGPGGVATARRRARSTGSDRPWGSCRAPSASRAFFSPRHSWCSTASRKVRPARWGPWAAERA